MESAPRRTWNQHQASENKISESIPRVAWNEHQAIEGKTPKRKKKFITQSNYKQY